jgi:hypothetical protein
MPDLIETLEGVLTGTDRAGAILHNCLFLGGGVTAYGRDCILELLRRQKTPQGRTYFAGAHHSAALFVTSGSLSMALFADHHNQYFSRLWYVSSTCLTQHHAGRIDVPFDPQFGHSAMSAFDPRDHPELAAEHVERVHSMLENLDLPLFTQSAVLQSQGSFTRFTAHVLRAFSDNEATALLLVVSALREDEHTGVVQFPVAARLMSGCDALFVPDHAKIEAECAHTWAPEL